VINSFNTTNQQNIIKALTVSSLVTGDMEQIRILPPEYPYYYVDFYLNNNQKIEITLITPEYFVVNDMETRHYYANGKELWNLFESVLGQPRPQSDSINSLFEATSIKTTKWKWDLNYRKNYIVKALLQGEKINTKTPDNLKMQYEMVFCLNGQQIPVEIYNDYYVFQGAYYYLPDTVNILERIVTAG